MDDLVKIYVIITSKDDKHRLHQAKPGYLYYTTNEKAGRHTAVQLTLSKKFDNVKLLSLTGRPGDTAADVAAAASETWDAVKSNKKEGDHVDG